MKLHCFKPVNLWQLVLAASVSQGRVSSSGPGPLGSRHPPLRDHGRSTPARPASREGSPHPVLPPFPLGKEDAAFLTLLCKIPLASGGFAPRQYPRPSEGETLQERHLHRARGSPSRPGPPFSLLLILLPPRGSLLLFLAPGLHPAPRSRASLLLPSCGPRENEISLSRSRRDLENGEGR